MGDTGIAILSLALQKAVAAITAHDTALAAVAFNSNGSKLATASTTVSAVYVCVCVCVCVCVYVCVCVCVHVCVCVCVYTRLFPELELYLSALSHIYRAQ